MIDPRIIFVSTVLIVVSTVAFLSAWFTLPTVKLIFLNKSCTNFASSSLDEVNSFSVFFESLLLTYLDAFSQSPLWTLVKKSVATSSGDCPNKLHAVNEKAIINVVIKMKVFFMLILLSF